MTADRDLQHPDITAAERTGYPRRFMSELPEDYSEETLREFTEEMEELFVDYCRFHSEIVERFACHYFLEFQEFIEEREREAE